MHIFISHSNKLGDKEATQKLADYISDRRIFCWVDFKDIKSGYWAEQVSKALNTADHYILVVSKNFLSSEECINELKIIAKSSMRHKVTPFFLDDYYFEDKDIRNRISYQIDSLQSVLLNNYSTFEEACAAVYANLPKELTIRDCNPKDFVFKSDMRSLEKYLGNDEVLTLPDMISTICERAFLNNKSLQKIIFPQSVKTIEKYAFAGCDNLCFVEGTGEVRACARNIVDKIDGKGDSDVPAVDVEKGIKYFGKIALGAKDDGMSEIVIREGTSAIAHGAFKEMFSLRKVNLPKTLAYIGDFAFKDCIKLKNINLTEDIGIGKKAFDGCPIDKF